MFPAIHHHLHAPCTPCGFTLVSALDPPMGDIKENWGEDDFDEGLQLEEARGLGVLVGGKPEPSRR